MLIGGYTEPSVQAYVPYCDETPLRLEEYSCIPYEIDVAFGQKISGASAFATATVSAFVASGETPLLALTVKVNEPAAVGVPEIIPVEEFRLKPPGNAPLAMLHVIGASLVASSVLLYASPNLPFGRVVVVIAGGVELGVTVRVAISDLLI